MQNTVDIYSLLLKVSMHQVIAVVLFRLLLTSLTCIKFNFSQKNHSNYYKKFELMLTRCAKAYRSSDSVV